MNAHREATRRLFFALWPDDSMQAAMAEATRSVVTGSDGAAVPPKNFHLTLAFLGAVAENRIADLTPIAARVALAFQNAAAATRRPATAGDAATTDHASPTGHSSPIAITLDHIDYWRKSEILCATSRTESAPAIALASALKHALTENGFAPDLKPFRTHATLARKVHRVTRDRNMQPVHWTFRDFHLVESRTARSGALYSSREIYPLDAPRR